MSLEKDAREYARLRFVIARTGNNPEDPKALKNQKDRVKSLERKLRKYGPKGHFEAIIKPLIDQYYEEIIRQGRG